MIVSSLRLKNVGPYRGEHVLRLEPKSYAIVARHHGDPERSNWSGKSYLVGAIRLALYGEHGHRYDDGWISEGEPTAEVELELSTGHRILRTRNPRSGRLYLFEPGRADKPMAQDEAAEAINRIVGLSKVDFKATCFFEQKRMSRFVTMEPSERIKVVSAWFRLEPLKECEGKAEARGAALEGSAKTIEGHRTAIEAREKEIWRKDEKGNPIWTKAKIEESIPLFEAEVERRRGSVSRLEDELEIAAHAAGAAARADDYARVVAEGKATRAEYEKLKLPVLREEAEKAKRAREGVSAACRSLVQSVQEKRELATGQFDGRCPVAGIDCPAKEHINARTAENRAALKSAVDAHSAWKQNLDVEQQREDSANARVREAERIQSRLEVLREQAKKLHSAIAASKTEGEAKDPTQVRRLLEAARDELAQSKTELDRIRSWQVELLKIEETRRQLDAKAKEVADRVGIYREMQAVFRAARRRVAEDSLAEIEEDANSILGEIGTDLTIEARWAREGKGLATACEACGHPFPPSAKVKNCERCGAARGAKVENKLEVHLSDVSGAAEDLGGVSFQLSASRWLREERGAPWATAVLDEPFGALDAAHRKRLSAHLASMLSGRYGFAQAFVVAHHASVLDALPGRIEIVREGRWSVPRVVE